MQRAAKVYVGLNLRKASISVTTAEGARDGEVRFIGAIPNTATDVAKLAKRLSAKADRLEFCYEAGGCVYRQLGTLGHGCATVAPSMTPRKPGERTKTDRRDSQKIAILHRSGDLTPVWFPMKCTRGCAIWCAPGSTP